MFSCICLRNRNSATYLASITEASVSQNKILRLYVNQEKAYYFFECAAEGQCVAELWPGDVNCPQNWDVSRTLPPDNWFLQVHSLIKKSEHGSDGRTGLFAVWDSMLATHHYCICLQKDRAFGLLNPSLAFPNWNAILRPPAVFSACFWHSAFALSCSQQQE